MKKSSTLHAIVIFALSAAVLYYFQAPKVQESITFFPIDPSAVFTTSETTLKQDGQNAIHWEINSVLNRKAYLRQDAGFLFANGRLQDELNKWAQNTKSLKQKKQIKDAQTALYQAITFHHAELHEQNGRIFSSQALSKDELYFISENQKRPFSFKVPKTQDERRWQEQLADETNRMLRYSWNKGIRYFSIPLENYHAIPLIAFNQQTIPGFSKKESAEIMGHLWEGLYKNYFLGIKKQDGTIISPIGSTIPLILIAKNKTHLLVLTETANGEPIVLRQVISAAD